MSTVQSHSLQSPGTCNCDNAIRASLLDVYSQLGALDDNSLVAEWMFNDAPTEDTDIANQPNPTTRFKEMFPANSAEPSHAPPQQKRRRLLPFTFKKPVDLAPPMRSNRSNANKSTIGKASKLDHISSGGRVVTPDSCTPPPPTARRMLLKRRRIGSEGSGSLRRNSGVKRINQASGRVSAFNDSVGRGSERPVSGRISTNTRSFFQLKPSDRKNVPQEPGFRHEDGRHPERPSSYFPTPIYLKFARPIHHSVTVEEDVNGLGEDWEEIEVVPDSPLYPLPNRGMNPSPVYARALEVDQQPSRAIKFRSQTDEDGRIRRHTFNMTSPRTIFTRSLKSLRPRSHLSQRTMSFSKHNHPASPKQQEELLSQIPGQSYRNSSPFSQSTLESAKFDVPELDAEALKKAETGPSSSSTGNHDMGYHHQFFLAAASEEAAKLPRSPPG
ncbi:hypothetical protein H0H93_006980 [Arthromyces matolae]|nr:hypothetical protein H0H93_006980 [Arthromyces matolae]